MNLRAQEIVHLYEVIRRTENARRRWNLRNRAERKAFEREAYEPRLDLGQEGVLKEGYHMEGDEGWKD